MADRFQLCKYKGNCCTHCGKSVEDMVARYGDVLRIFQFHHVDPTTKHPDYENLIRRVISTEQLEEVDKCVLLCSVCHGVIEAQQNNVEIILTVVYDGQKAEQRLKGQLILDGVERTGTFLTTEHLLVIPYKVYLNSRSHVVMFGIELKVRFNEFIRNHKNMMIEALDGTPLLLLVTDTEGSVTLEYSINFGLVPIEVFGSNRSDVIQCWIRNGKALSRDGQVIERGMIRVRGLRWG